MLSVVHVCNLICVNLIQDGFMCILILEFCFLGALFRSARFTKRSYIVTFLTIYILTCTGYDACQDKRKQKCQYVQIVDLADIELWYLEKTGILK